MAKIRLVNDAFLKSEKTIMDADVVAEFHSMAEATAHLVDQKLNFVFDAVGGYFTDGKGNAYFVTPEPSLAETEEESFIEA